MRQFYLKVFNLIKWITIDWLLKNVIKAPTNGSNPSSMPMFSWRIWVQ
jgi:hypothetical protein